MWVDAHQMVHTSEPNHWTTVVRLSPSSLAAFRRTPPAWVHELLDDFEDDFFGWWDAQHIDPAEEILYVERLPPRLTLGLAGPPIATLEVLGAQLVRQSVRWWLDYVWALRDCLADPQAILEVDQRSPLYSTPTDQQWSQAQAGAESPRGVKGRPSGNASALTHTRAMRRTIGEPRVMQIRRTAIDPADSAFRESPESPVAPIAYIRPPQGERDSAAAGNPVPKDDGGRS